MEAAMNLIDSFKVACVLMVKSSAPDSEGGSITNWTDGSAFTASIVFNSSVEARVAQQQSVKNLYTVTTDKNAALEYHDVFKRVSDGKIFRVTSDGEDAKTPDAATFSFSQVSAEEWTLT
jgi:hypothetical protein